jgi:hypothetical protein
MEFQIKDKIRLSQSLVVERYKFILREIQRLNKDIYHYILIFQTLNTAIIGGGLAVLINWKKIQTQPALSIVLSKIIEWLIIFVSSFIIVSIISGILSWFDYRKEESKLINEILGENYRSLPTFKNLLRWNETYIILFMIIFIILAVFIIETRLIPFLQGNQIFF